MTKTPSTPESAPLAGGRVIGTGGRIIGGVVGVPAPDPGWHPLPKVSGVTVGVVDTGVLLDASRAPHPWFDGHLSYCAEDDEDKVPEKGTIGPSDGHGTVIAGLILREAPTARIRLWGTLDKGQLPDQGGDGLGDDNDRAVAAAIRALAANPEVQVINLSFGGGVFAEDHKPVLLREALREVDYDRVAVVASAGNDASSRKAWPAAFRRVISVGALELGDPTDRTAPPIAGFSNWGPWITSYAPGVDLVAPFVDNPNLTAEGPDGVTLGPYSGWARCQGTSLASAVVAGIIAEHAARRDVTGARAAKEVLDAAPRVHGGAAWIRGLNG